MTSAIPAPGAHGGDGARVAAALGLDPATVLDLSASLNPVAPDPGPVVARHLPALGRYPDPTRATAALAEVLGVERERVVLTNGGAEAIALVGALVGGRVDEPDFSLYPRAPATDCRGDGWAPAVPPRWRSDPHSPSGRSAGSDERAGVWDEAFRPLATGTWTSPPERAEAIVVGSLTKLLACPGLRLGYLVAPATELGERLVPAVRALQPGWSVGGLACEALPDLLAAVDLPGWCAAVSSLRSALADALRSRGLAVEAHRAPWVLVGDPGGLRDGLAHQGVVVRDCASFGLPATLRIAVPDEVGRARLVGALDRFLDPTPT